MSKLVTIAASVGMLGIVGGVAAVGAFSPAPKPAQVRLVSPAADTVTSTPTDTVTVTATPTETATPTATATVTHAPAPVESTQAPAPVPVQTKAAVVSSPAPEPAPAPAPAGPLAPLPHDEAPGSTPGQTGVFGGGAPEPSATK